MLQDEIASVFVDDTTRARLGSCLSELDDVAMTFRKATQVCLRVCLHPRAPGVAW